MTYSYYDEDYQLDNEELLNRQLEQERNRPVDGNNAWIRDTWARKRMYHDNELDYDT